jgi:hypothetical protein
MRRRSWSLEREPDGEEQRGNIILSYTLPRSVNILQLQDFNTLYPFLGTRIF